MQDYGSGGPHPIVTDLNGASLANEQTQFDKNLHSSEKLEDNKENLSSLGPETGLLSDENHQLSVLKFGAGGDDQSHVTLPQIKDQVRNSQAPRTMRKDMRHLFTKNISRQDLEPI